MKKAFIAIIVVASVYLFMFVLNNSYGITPPGEAGVVVTLGDVGEKVNHGFTMKWPFISKLENYSVRQQTKDYEHFALKTSSLQNVFLSFSVIYQVNEEKLLDMVKEYDMSNYTQDILSPKVEAAIQDVVGKNDVWFLITDKQLVADAFEYILADKVAEDNYLLVRDVLLKTPKFDADFENQVLAKMTDEVKIERAKLQTEIVKEEAKQMLEKASVDPIVVEKMSKALTNPLIIKYEAMKALNKWNGEAPNTVISGSESALPIVGVSK